MPDYVPEFLPIAEPLEAKIRGFFILLQGKFIGQQPISRRVNLSIQPRVEPEPSSLESLDGLLGEYANAADWLEMPHGLGFISSGEPAGEHPEWEYDWLSLHMPPGAEDGKSWVKMVVHRATGQAGKRVSAEPWTMLSYSPRGNAKAESPIIPAGMEVIHFSKRDRNSGKELASVTEIYEEKPPVASSTT